MQLAEQYRPKTFEDVVGQPKAVKRLQLLAKRGLGGRSYWFSGLSGTGKTSLAMIVADHVTGDIDHIESIDAVRTTPASLDRWRQRLRCKPMFARGLVLVINEAHWLKNETIGHLLNMTDPSIPESIPEWAAIIFTTTKSGQASLFADCDDCAPLMSRCQVFELESRLSVLELDFACHLRSVAQSEGMDGQDLESYIRLVRENDGNLRACFQEIESGLMLC